MMQKPIAAIATPYGKGAISIIRISGENVISIVGHLFPKTSLTKIKPNTMKHTQLIEKNQLIDDVMVVTYYAPKSYTGEDMIEIFTHGGIRVTQNVLQAVLRCGIDLAKPGEFTERAYLNKKIDLIQAESVMDIIEAENDLQIQIAQAGHQSQISKTITEYKQIIMGWITHIEVNIDYPEYESENQVTQSFLKPKIQAFLEEVKKAIIASKRNNIISHGIKTAIIGKPNVGKSSLLNALIKEDKAIVTDIPGTTRDIVEGSLHLGGIKLHLIDTAGIRHSEDTIERIGIDKSKKMMDQAELVIFVLDQTKPLDQEETTLLTSLNNKPYILVGNKEDLGENQTGLDVISISAKNSTHLDQLESKINELFDIANIQTTDLKYLSNERQISLLEKSYEHLVKALQSTLTETPIDMIQLDLRDAWEALSEITGDTYHESLVDDMFRRFCLGK